jgi:hypothetical protein
MFKQNTAVQTQRTSCSGDSKSSKSPCTTCTSPHMPLRNSSVDCSCNSNQSSRSAQLLATFCVQQLLLLAANPYLSAQVARAQYLVYLSWLQQFFKFCWYVCCPMWDVQVAYAQHKHHATRLI